MSDGVVIHLSMEDADFLARSLNSDIPYYTRGLDTLRWLLSLGDAEFTKGLLDEGLSSQLTKDDVVARVENTEKLVSIYSAVTSDIIHQIMA